MTRPSLRLLVPLTAVLMLTVVAISAAPPETWTSRIRRIDVPDQQPADWPRPVQQSTAVPREEFDRLLRTAQLGTPEPQQAHITAARYSATLTGTSLRDGRAALTVRRVGVDPLLLPLGDFNVALSNLAWSDRPAVWGSDESGRPWLLADGSTSDLTAAWSAAGRMLPDEVDFDLSWPDATVAVLDLKVPRDRILRSTPEALRMEEGSDAEWQVWRIQLGSERRCRISVQQRPTTSTRQPTVLYEHEMAAVVREEDLRFQTLFQVEVFDAPVTELTFAIPSSIEVYAVVYGTDVPLAWTRSSDAQSAGTLTVRLPGALLGRSRSIRIDGLALHKPGQPTTSPQITLPKGVFLSGRHVLTIVAPLQLRSVRPNGFRQQGALTTVPEGEQVTFRQLLPDAQLILDVRRPRAALAAQVASLLETGEDSWTLTSEIAWSSSSGGVFQTACQFPADWEITDVQLASVPGTSRLAGWDVQPQAGGPSLVMVEFLEAIEPGRPHTVKLLARRRPPALGQSFAVPVPHPSNCDTVETTFGLIVPAGLSPQLSDDARLERISPPEESAFSTLRRRPLTRTHSEFWYRGESLEATGSLQLHSRLRPVAATTDVIVEAAPAEYRERFRIRCRTEGQPLDRLFVYLTQPGGEVRWSVLLPRPGDLPAVRLPVSQHVEWNCPPTGELWELRLPPLPAGPIEIQGTRGTRWPATTRPALLFVPQAVDRRGSLRLRSPESLELIVDTRGLDPQSAVPGGANTEADPAETGTTFVTQTWQYDAFDDELSIARLDPEPSREFPAMVSLQLRSLISTNADGFDLYRARIRLENGSPREELRIQLPSPAVLQEVTVAGETTVPNTQGEEILIPGLDATRHDLVELLYRVPAHGQAVRDRRRVIVPRIKATVLGFEWEFALPPSVRLFSEPEQVRLTRPLPVSTWTECLFGPLGRPREESFFNPFAAESWRELLQPREVLASSVGDLSGELMAPVEWQVHRAVAAVVPGELWLETWHSTRTRLLSWIALAVTMGVGVLLRIIGWKYRDRLAAYWLTLLAAIAVCSPSPYAEFAGGAVAGTIVALLAPRRSWLVQRPGSSSVPVGSTQSFHFGAPAGLALMLSWIVSIGIAQDTTPRPVSNGSPQIPPVNGKPAPTTGTGITKPIGEATSTTEINGMTVYVPVDANGRPSETLPLVYVAPELLAKLKESARAQLPPPVTLMSSAQYRAIVAAGGGVTLQAKFRVHVLNASVERMLALPLPDAVLAGADACRINGQPHPITMADDGRGFLVTLPRAPADDNTAAPAPRTTSFDVELDLKRVGSKTTQGGAFTSVIPGITDTRWSVELPEPTEFLEVLGARGVSTRTADRRGIHVEFGSGTRAEVRWSQTPPEIKPARLEVSRLQTLDLRPESAELKFRIRCAVLEGQIDVLDLDLPDRCLVREGDIRAAGLLRAEVVPASEGPARLHLSFAEPQRQTIVIDGTLVIPAADSSSVTPLPRFAITRGSQLRVSTVQNWWWLGAATEFRLDTPNLETDLLGTITATDFVQAWGDSPPVGRPHLVFQPREGSTPAFSLTPQTARRRALEWVQTGQIGKRRLDWTLTARLEATQAPVYQHALLVDRRLQIESISVRENGAERLLRWSETRQNASPTRLMLFLTDKTTGIQQLTLRGSLPLRQGPAIPLPFVRYEEAELVDSRWELFRDAEVDVDLVLPRGVPPFEIDDDLSTEEGPTLVARYQIADPDPKTSIRVSSRHAVCTARTAALLGKSDERGWKLTGQLWLTPQGESPRRLGVRFPTSVDPARVRIEQAEAVWHDPVDGWRRLDLTLPPDPTEVAVSFEAVIEEPTRGDWELPWPAPLQASLHEMCLLTTPPDLWTPLVGTELKPDEAPGWAEEFLEERMPETPSALYRLSTPPVKLRRSASPSHLDEPVVRLLDHALWLTDAGGRYGVTRAFLSQTREAIDFTIPEGFQPVALFLDGRPLALPNAVEGQWHVPLIGGGRESMLVMMWQQRQPDIRGFVMAEREPLPWPTRIKVARSLVAVVPPRTGWLVNRSGQPRLDWMDAAFDRIEMLLERQTSLDGDPRAAAANRELIDELQSRVSMRLPTLTARPSASLTVRLERWNRLVDAINNLDPPTRPETRASDEQPLSHLDEQFLDHPQALRAIATSESPAIGFWLLDRNWLATVAALLLGLVVIPVLRYLIRLEWGEWLNARVTVSWLLLGLFWWLYLTPGVLGPAMIAIAVFRAALHRKPRPESHSTPG